MILIKNAIIICADSAYHQSKNDILIDHGQIIRIDDHIDHNESMQVIELDNLHVSIGWIDSSVSFGTPGFEERQGVENAIEAAGKSGFTSLLLNPNNRPNPENKSGINSLLSYYQNDYVKIHPVGSLSMGQHGVDLTEIYDMYRAGAVSFYDFKKDIHNANLLKVGLQYASSFGAVLQSFPQDQDIAGKGMVNEDENTIHLGIKSIPSFAESLRISRDLNIAKYTGGKLHIPTVTTPSGLQLIKEAKQQGVAVTCSVAAHHLLLDSRSLADFDTRFKVQPPLRDEDTVKALKTYVEDGTVDMITSDHTPLNIELKELEFDQASYGTIGLESCFGTINALFETEKTVKQLTAAYEVFNIEKPSIEVGSTAVLTLFNPEPSYEFTQSHVISESKNSAMIGSRLKGQVYGIIQRKNLLLNDRH
jgi:dihydroorotase